MLVPILALNRAKSIWGEDSLEFKCALPIFHGGPFFLLIRLVFFFFFQDLKDGKRHQMLLHLYLVYGDIC